MKITTTLCIMLSACLISFGQTPPQSSVTNWKSIGHKTTIAQKLVINVKRLGADATGSTPCDEYVQLALNNSRQTGAIIYFPKGTYFLTKPIELTSNQYLAGDGSEKTLLRFDLGGRNHLIYARGTTFAQWKKLNQNFLKGERNITLDNEFLQAGDLIRFKVSDEDKISSSWAKGTVGQISKVVKASKTEIQLADELRLDLTTKNEAQFIKITPERNLGVVNLRIVRSDATQGQTDNIHFEYTENALVSGVVSDSCNFAHVNNMYAYRSRIEGSHFRNAFHYGGGGKAYGVVIQFTSGQCMVENNIFQQLRHSILFQAGSHGNIVSYNYSYDPYWTGVFSPSSFAGDIVLHGNYPFLNLIEGNIAQNLVIDNSHGINGEGNTFLRNRLEHAGIFMNCNPASDGQNFIGNEVTGSGNITHNFVPFPKGLYSLCGTGHYEYGNWHQTKLVPEDITSMVATLYLPNEPLFLTKSDFPSIGYPNKPGSGTIPAKRRNEEEKKTVDYPFDMVLGLQFKSFEVQEDEDGAVLIWKTNTLDECESFQIHRLDKDGSSKIDDIGCTGQPNKEIIYVDYNVDRSKRSTQYFVRHMDIFGGTIDSDTADLFPQNVGIKTGISDDRVLHFSETVTGLRLFDLSGSMLTTVQFDDRRYQLPAEIRPGIYVVELTSGNGEITRNKIGVY
jgi:hypothetical protein